MNGSGLWQRFEFVARDFQSKLIFARFMTQILAVKPDWQKSYDLLPRRADLRFSRKPFPYDLEVGASGTFRLCAATPSVTLSWIQPLVKAILSHLARNCVWNKVAVDGWPARGPTDTNRGLVRFGLEIQECEWLPSATGLGSGQDRECDREREIARHFLCLARSFSFRFRHKIKPGWH